ncbi:uncharacterized protein [Blastocystis hominis]|uniref:Triosephosphate isomerase n=1 Tax=Blastocystis hominis TaxID=12968 RepID=D8M4H2_BLAHO|nr:uncharacterized protein [Blastocystis hominis]CBK22961.2 unnamed protein product [Blastocystis hominis]|eukprot:XP_012897009.1 uncharacterized protein [Blastocystis hominis]
MPRRLFIGGNWKCNGTVSSLTELINAFNAAGDLKTDRDIVIAPTALHISLAKNLLRKEIEVSAQNIWKVNGYGAFTGELSAPMLKDFGVNWTLLGHSERRHTVAAESDELIAEKTKIALANGVKVILCIGELLEDRESGKTMDVCKAQLQAVVDVLEEKDWENIVIAYEPVWAIGTGKTATPDVAEETHAQIRAYMASAVSPAVAENVRIIYGGSVSTKNCADLIKKEDIDGFLVGGASLKPDFVQIINC